MNYKLIDQCPQRNLLFTISFSTRNFSVLENTVCALILAIVLFHAFFKRAFEGRMITE